MAANGFLQNGYMQLYNVLQIVIQSFENLWKLWKFLTALPKNLKYSGLETKIETKLLNYWSKMLMHSFVVTF